MANSFWSLADLHTESWQSRDVAATNPMPREAAEEITMEQIDGYDGIDPSIETGTVEYWKARARQAERRSQRSEREKTELILEIEQLKLAALGAKSPRLDRRRAIIADGALGGRSSAPKGFGR